MEKFVKAVWDVSPDMKIVVEASVTTTQNLNLVPSLKPSDPRVSFQGCHCDAACVLVRWLRHAVDDEKQAAKRMKIS